MPLSSADITRLVAAGGVRKGKRTTNGSSARIRWFDGTTWHAGKPPLDSNPHYEGKTGSKRRSRKGRVVTNPNGSRYIVGQYGDTRVVATTSAP